MTKKERLTGVGTSRNYGVISKKPLLIRRFVSSNLGIRNFEATRHKRLSGETHNKRIKAYGSRDTKELQKQFRRSPISPKYL